MKYPWWLIKAEIVFKLRNWKKLTRLDCPKSPIEVYNTIVIYGFGLENYSFKNGRFVRKNNAQKKKQEVASS